MDLALHCEVMDNPKGGGEGIPRSYGGFTSEKYNLTQIYFWLKTKIYAFAHAYINAS